MGPADDLSEQYGNEVPRWFYRNTVQSDELLCASAYGASPGYRSSRRHDVPDCTDALLFCAVTVSARSSTHSRLISAAAVPRGGGI